MKQKLLKLLQTLLLIYKIAAILFAIITIVKEIVNMNRKNDNS